MKVIQEYQQEPFILVENMEEAPSKGTRSQRKHHRRALTREVPALFESKRPSMPATKPVNLKKPGDTHRIRGSYLR